MLPALRSQVAQILGKGADWEVVSTPTWPLLRIADRGISVLAAQHLLRAAGVPGVPADGAFGRSTADGVFEFQRRHRMEITGMIGGGSWPLLAVPVKPGQGGEAGAAVQALLKRPGARQFQMPAQVDRATWQRLLSTA
jgi:peptidoglycan hydrolase-like protein with peptidoglycan-binding domain